MECIDERAIRKQMYSRGDGELTNEKMYSICYNHHGGDLVLFR